MWEEALEVISTFEDQIIAASQASDPQRTPSSDLNRQRHLDLARRIARLYQTAMFACGDAGKPHRVMDLYRRMSHYLQRAVPGGKPLNLILRESFSYTSILRHCARSKFGARRKEAEWWFQEMLRVGVPPSLVSARFVLLACEKETHSQQQHDKNPAARTAGNFSNYDAAKRWFPIGHDIVKNGDIDELRVKRCRPAKATWWKQTSHESKNNAPLNGYSKYSIITTQ